MFSYGDVTMSPNSYEYWDLYSSPLYREKSQGAFCEQQWAIELKHSLQKDKVALNNHIVEHVEDVILLQQNSPILIGTRVVGIPFA
jgi:hypothetical protein